MSVFHWQLLNTYYTLMFEAVTSHGGVINQMIGDGLMALFGAPQALENSAQSAFDAAQDMVAMIEMLNQERLANGEVEIKIGIGIATGEVVAGYVGTDSRAMYTCIGSTVNLAARLEAQTKVVGCTLLDDQATKSELVGTVELQGMPDVEIRGFKTPMELFSF